MQTMNWQPVLTVTRARFKGTINRMQNSYWRSLFHFYFISLKMNMTMFPRPCSSSCLTS